jgi:hypothetical protein
MSVQFLHNFAKIMAGNFHNHPLWTRLPHLVASSHFSTISSFIMTTSRKPTKKDNPYENEDGKPPARKPTPPRCNPFTKEDAKSPVKKTPPASKHPAVSPSIPHLVCPSPASPVSIHSTRHPAGASPPLLASPSLPTVTSTSGGTIPKVRLEDFGITPVSTSRNQKDSVLKCCLIKEPNGYTLVFRCECLDPTNEFGSWAEKVMAETTYKGIKEETWMTLLGFDKVYMNWYHENQEMKNPKNYNIRLFLIRCNNNKVIPKEDIVRLGKHICACVNATPKNKTTLHLDEQSFFWIGDDVTWSDVIGFDASLTSLENVTTKRPAPGYYERFKKTIHSHFHAGSFGTELAAHLHAPPEEIHPSLRLPSVASNDYQEQNDDSSLDNAED